MRMAVWLFLAVVGGFSGSFLVNRARHTPEPHRLALDTNFDKFDKNELAPESPGVNFDATVSVKTENSATPGILRIYSDAVLPSIGGAGAGSYLTAEIGKDYAKILAVEAGACRILAEYRGETGECGTLPHQVRLRRRTPAIELVCDGKLLASARHEGFAGGLAGSAATAGVELSQWRVQPCGVVSFSDDFMRAGDENGEWRSAGPAKWEVRSLDNPGRSANAFVYQGGGSAGGMSLTGSEQWDNYRAEVSALGQQQGEIGIAVSAAESAPGEIPERFCLVKWLAADVDQAKDGKPRLEMVSYVNKEKTVLASREGGYRPWQWYRLSAELVGGTVTVYIDGKAALSASDPHWSGGRAGVYVKGEKPAEFDDFKVSSLLAVDGRVLTTGAWSLIGRGWSVPAEGALALDAAGAEPAFAATGGPEWESARAEAEFSGGAAAPRGLAVCYRNPGNYLGCIVDPAAGTRRLVDVAGGEETVLAEEKLPPGEPRLEVSLERGYLKSGGICAFVKETRPGRCAVVSLPGWRAAEPESKLLVRGFSASSIDAPLPAASINKMFDDEQLMRVWSGAGADWENKLVTNDGLAQAFWHRAPLFGDAEIEAQLPEKKDKAWMLALSLCKPRNADKPNNGYVLALERGADSFKLQLYREGQAAESLDLAGEADPARARLRRAGPYVLVYLDDAVRLAWRDPEPLGGDRAAWACKGMTLDPEKVRVYNRGLHDYSFNNAPADWRVCGGVWQVTNRWECDPRWSFMAGMPPALAKLRAAAYQNKTTDGGVWVAQSLLDQAARYPDQSAKLAGIWQKNIVGGNIAVECFVGQMMDASRGGSNYGNYVQNFNLTLCGDGRSLASGYTFVFGGWANTKSAILKNGKIVASADRSGGFQNVIPATNDIHRKWFCLRAEKRSGEISFTVRMQNNGNGDDVKLLDLSYVDPEPMGAGHVGVWTYNDGMLVARCRVSAELEEGTEDPFADYPAAAACFYDENK